MAASGSRTLACRRVGSESVRRHSCCAGPKNTEWAPSGQCVVLVEIVSFVLK